MQSRPALLDLSADLLRSTAQWLPPQDRLNFALTSKRLFKDTWGDFAEEDLLSRYRFESKLQFALDVEFTSARRCTQEGAESFPVVSTISAIKDQRCLRMVPQRSRVQHCFTAVSSCGMLVAVLTYDNILRILRPRSNEVVATADVGHVCRIDIWDEAVGRRIPQLEVQTSASTFEETNGVDVEIGFGFTSDDRAVFISSKSFLRIFDLRIGSETLLTRSKCLAASEAKPFLGGDDACVGGSCAISPDGTTAAWVLFAHSPALAYVSIWDIQSGACRGAIRVSRIHRRPFCGLGWARAEFSPNGRYVICIVNSSKKKVSAVRLDNSFQCLKLSEYVFAVYEFFNSCHLDVSMTFDTVRKEKSWLDTTPERYPMELAFSLQNVLSGLKTDQDTDGTMSKLQKLRVPRLRFNFLHSCPTEATYTAISCNSRPRWLIAKQPICSLVTGVQEAQTILSTSPYTNKMQRMTRKDSPASSDLIRGNSFIINNQFAFRGMPWRAGFASATALSISGQWIAGVTLVENHAVVCLRNTTYLEQFGERLEDRLHEEG